MKWLLILAMGSYHSNFMMKYPDPFPSQHECKEAGEIWKQQRQSNFYVCLPSSMRPD